MNYPKVKDSLLHKNVTTPLGNGKVICDFENAFDENWLNDRRIILYKVRLDSTGDTELFKPEEVKEIGMPSVKEIMDTIKIITDDFFSSTQKMKGTINSFGELAPVTPSSVIPHQIKIVNHGQLTIRNSGIRC